MQNGPLVEIPPGYCFIPSCGHDQNPTSARTTTSTVTPSSSPSHSRTTSTTTIFGPTITASPSTTHNKRSTDPTPAPANEAKPMIGTHAFAGFPTDAAIPVGAGPICIVRCDWAKLENSSTQSVSASTMMSVSKSTMDISITPTSSPSPSPSTTTTILGTLTLKLPGSPTLSPVVPSNQQHRRPFSAGEITGTVFAGLGGLALLLAGAWLVTRKVRQVRARLNKHNQGVQRDFERGVWEEEGGEGVPELGGRKEEGGKKEDVEMGAMHTGKESEKGTGLTEAKRGVFLR